MHQAPHQIDTCKQQREAQIVEERLVRKIDRIEELAALVDRQPIVAAVAVEAAGDVVDHLREGERDHDEVDAARAQRQRADDARGERRHRNGERPGDPRAAHALEREDADDEGAAAKESGMAEAHHAAVAEREIQAGGGDGVDQHAAREADVEQVIHRLHHERKDRQQDEDYDRPDHPRAGKRPCGRK